MKFLSRFYIFIVFAILYAPILVVILFSFNASGDLSSFSGFTMHWYSELFKDGQALEALKNSLIIAVASSFFATVMGTFAAFSIAHSKNKYYRVSYLELSLNHHIGLCQWQQDNFHTCRTSQELEQALNDLLPLVDHKNTYLSIRFDSDEKIAFEKEHNFGSNLLIIKLH